MSLLTLCLVMLMGLDRRDSSAGGTGAIFAGKHELQSPIPTPNNKEIYLNRGIIQPVAKPILPALASCSRKRKSICGPRTLSTSSSRDAKQFRS